MKYLISTLLTLAALFSATSHAAQALDIALEMKSFKAEYYSSSKTGVVKVAGCNQCEEDIYRFNSTVKILKNEKSITIEQFVQDYWNAEYPTIFLDPATKLIILIAY